MTDIQPEKVCVYGTTVVGQDRRIDQRQTRLRLLLHNTQTPYNWVWLDQLPLHRRYHVRTALLRRMDLPPTTNIDFPLLDLGEMGLFPGSVDEDEIHRHLISRQQYVWVSPNPPL